MNDSIEQKETFELETKDKLEKILAALFLVTSHLDTTNPVRLELRNQGTLLLKGYLTGLDIEPAKKATLAFLHVGLLAKEFNPENVLVIERELTALRSKTHQINDSVVSALFVKDEELTLAQPEDNKLFPGTEVNHGQQGLPDPIRQTNKETETFKDTYVKPKTSESLNSALKKYESPKSTLNKKDEKKARRLHVLELLSKTELRTIRDISKHFTDCSEKTIQRELNDLVDEKFIVRVGDKRWSTYKLK